MTPHDFRLVKETFKRASKLEGNERELFISSKLKDRSDLIDEVAQLLNHQMEERDFMVVEKSDARSNHSTSTTKAYLQKSLLSTSQAFSWMSSILANKRRRAVLASSLVLVLVSIGLVSQMTIADEIANVRGKELENTRDVKVQFLTGWIEDEIREAEMRTSDPAFIQGVNDLVKLGSREGATIKDVATSDELRRVENLFRAKIGTRGYYGGAVHDRNGRVVATFHADLEPWFAKRFSSLGMKYLLQAFSGNGNVVYTPPTLDSELYNNFGAPNPGALQGFMIPVKHANGEFNALVGVGFSADERFSDILNLTEPGLTGETYAIDNQGRMLSQSRFINQIRNDGLIAESEQHTMLRVSVRDPGGELREGFQPTHSSEVWPLTRSAVELINASTMRDSDGFEGTILKPYRNYRGIDVLGAWKWVPEYGFGIISEMELSEANRPLARLDMVFLVVYGLCVVLVGVVIGSSFSFVKLRKQLKESSRLGQYTLLKQIDEGGVGEIWTAKHQFLARPTAVKIIKSDQLTSETIRRFDREAQLASRLKHPNTIQVFDYGQTEDGHYYYAMELLEGANLAQLVKNSGPFSPARVVYILKQICSSLNEAHSMGIVHRDVKPQNVMLCVHGGEYDFVKLLDFGLVKLIDREDLEALTKPHEVSGTLMYMPPERIRNPERVDPRSDIYSLGAVGSFLLTGKPCFEIKTDVDLIYQIIRGEPKLEWGGVPGDTPEQLEAFLLQCLSKNPEERPDSAKTCVEFFSGLERMYRWEQSDAQDCWAKLAERI